MKKTLKMVGLTLFTFLLYTNNVFATSAKIDLCADEQVLKAFQISGYLLIVAKIFVPILLVIFGFVAMFKAVVGDPDALKKQIPIFIKEIIAALVIFVLPTIIDFAFTLIPDSDNSLDKYEPCKTCLFEPGSSSCKAK